MIISAAVKILLKKENREVTILCHRHGDAYRILKDLGFNPSDFETVKKRGSCCAKIGKHTVIDMKTGEQKERLVWEIDKEIPIFTQDRNYIEKFV